MTLGSSTTRRFDATSLPPMEAVIGTVAVGPSVVLIGKAAFVSPAETSIAPGTRARDGWALWSSTSWPPGSAGWARVTSPELAVPPRTVAGASESATTTGSTGSSFSSGLPGRPPGSPGPAPEPFRLHFLPFFAPFFAFLHFLALAAVAVSPGPPEASAEAAGARPAPSRAEATSSTIRRRAVMGLESARGARNREELDE